MPPEGTGSWWDRREALHDRYLAELPAFEAVIAELTHAIDVTLAEAQVSAVTRGRVKSFDAFYRKLLERSAHDTHVEEPFRFITDLVGLRVVTPFIEDISHIAERLRDHFELVEVDDKAANLSVREFGYDSTHLLLAIPEDLLQRHGPLSVQVVEVQLRTILQDAWAEVEHELVYKADLDVVDTQVRRKLLALNATLSLADTIFQELRDYQKRRYVELRERHQKLMDKVSTIPEKMGRVWRGEPPISVSEEESLRHGEHADDPEAELSNLVVRALQAHLDADLETAVALYSKVLAVKPTYAIFNHRGIAYFTMSEYEKAVHDFTQAIELSPEQARAYTNRGLARRMAGRASEALSDFDRSLELDPMWADTLYGRALTHYDLGNIPAALRDCDRAIAVKPDFLQVLRFKRFIQDADI